jgi:hypothetical protein
VRFDRRQSSNCCVTFPTIEIRLGTYRCGQPGQQHGRRIPSLSSEHTLSTCCRLVSSFLTEMVQQIHSLRASGVMSSHTERAFASHESASRRSAGRLCTTPLEIRTVAIWLARSRKLSEFGVCQRTAYLIREYNSDSGTVAAGSAVARSSFWAASRLLRDVATHAIGEFRWVVANWDMMGFGTRWVRTRVIFDNLLRHTEGPDSHSLFQSDLDLNIDYRIARIVWMVYSPSAMLNQATLQPRHHWQG